MKKITVLVGLVYALIFMSGMCFDKMTEKEDIKNYMLTTTSAKAEIMVHEADLTIMSQCPPAILGTLDPFAVSRQTCFRALVSWLVTL